MKNFIFSWLGCFIAFLFVGSSIKAQITEVGNNITSLEELQDGDAIAFWNTGRSAYIFLDLKNSQPAYMMRTAIPTGEVASSNYFFIVRKTAEGKYKFQDKNGNYMPVFGKSEIPRPSITAGEFTITQSGQNWLIQTPDGIYFNGKGNNSDFLGWDDSGENSLYEIRKVTLAENEAATAFSTTLNNAKQYSIGNGLGEFQDPDGVLAAALAEAEAKTPEEPAERLAIIGKLNTALSMISINQPEPGKFYRFKSVDGKYIQSFAENGTGRPKMVDEATDKTTVFYLSSNHTLTGCNALNIASREFTTNADKTFSFVASQAVPGKYTITCTNDNINGNPSWHKGTGTPLLLDRTTNGITDKNCAWTIEEVTDEDQQPSLSKSISAEYATLAAPVALTIPDGIEAYTVTVDANKATATLTEVNDVIPAGTAVVLKAVAKSNNFTFTFASQASTNNLNDLIGVYTETAIDGNTNAYILGNGSQGIGFYQMSADDRTLATNKAYLVLPTEASAVRSIIFSDGTTTGIESTVAEGTEAEEYYDLQGRRVMNPTKGIYVTKSGKKVVINK